MSWISNTTAKPILTIGGVDYSNELENLTISDQSLVNTGVALTGGTCVLVEQPGGNRLVNYDKQKFLRGTEVLLDLEIDGVVKRHPRGSLLVIDSSYDPSARSITLTVGCHLSLHSMTNEVGLLDQFIDAPLPETAGFSDLANAVHSEGNYIFVDKDGIIQKRQFFGNDGWGSNKEGAAWVSVRDYTALSSAPLGTGQTPPDRITVTYNWLVDADEDAPNEDPDTGNVFDEDLTESLYYLEHPANLKKIQKICSVVGGQQVCRDVPINDAKRTFSVTKTERGTRFYGGPGGSTSQEVQITEGPAVELQGSYYAERYSWDLARNGGVDQGIALQGLDPIRQSRIERRYEYGSGGEVLKIVEKQYRNMLSAMTQNDWRSGGAETQTNYDPSQPPTSASRGFLTEPPTDKMYLEAQITTSYFYSDDKTTQIVETLKSAARCNGVGIYPPFGERVLQDIDATNNGIKTIVKRTSRGGLLNPTQPPRVTPGQSKVTKSAVYEEESATYTPTSYGSIVLQTSVPFANPNHTEAQARVQAAGFGRLLRMMIEGDSAGIRVVEAMRPEIFDYYPGQPFSYWDRTEQQLIKLRMNATSWAVSGDQAICATDGIFIGLSNGTVDLPSNADAAAVIPALEDLNAKQSVADAAQADLDAITSACNENSMLLDAIYQEILDRNAPDFTFDVKVITKEFEVTTGAPAADQVLDVHVAPAPFIVTVNAEPADQTFEVTAVEAHEVKVITSFDVTVA